MKRSHRHNRLLPALFLITGIFAGLCTRTSAYIFSEDGEVAAVLDSVVASEEHIDSLTPAPGNMFRLSFRDVSFNYRQHAVDVLRLLPGTYTGFFDTYGNRENVRLFSTRPAQTAVLINGTPAGAADHLGTDLHLIPLQSILRIETVPVGAALVYGTAPPGGAVNIVTRGFHHQLPFYQFTTLTREDGQEYAGHLHFSQRIYRNLNFYMSSLLKKNTTEGNDYSAIQYNMKLDAYLRNGWEGSFYSYNHTDDRQSQKVTPADGQLPSSTEPDVEFGGQKLEEEYSLTQLNLSGTPYRNNATRLRYYKTSTVRNYAKKEFYLTWSDIGILLSQELHHLADGHAFNAALDIHHKTYEFQISDANDGYTATTPTLDDSLSEPATITDYTVSLRATDRTTVAQRLDINASLALNLYGYGSGAQLLPAVAMEYPLGTATVMYAVAERTFANPVPMEQSKRRSPHTLYAMRVENGTLRPERGYTVTAGCKFDNNGPLTANASLFGKQVNDAIYWNWTSRQLTDNDTALFLANRSGTETHGGLMADIRFRLFGKKINGGLSLTQLFDTGTKSLGRTPSLPNTKIGYFLRASQMLKADQLMFTGITFNGEYVGEQHKRYWNGDDGPIPSQSFLDITLFYNILYIKTYFTVRNILNKADTDLGETLEFDAGARRFFGFPRPPMDFRFGVSLELGGVYAAAEENEEFDYSAVDTDGDGIYDSDDECPETKEDFDNFRDDDGCPDSDNDRDGVPDDRDKCPHTPLSAKVDVDGCTVKKAAPRPTGPARPAVRNIAVLDVHGGGIAPEQLPGLTGTLHKALADAPGYTAMPLTEMHALLGDTVRAALAACTTPACITAAAAPLNVPFTVKLAISKTGRTFTLVLQLIDSSSSKTVTELTEKFMGPATAISAGVESIAKKLIQRDR